MNERPTVGPGMSRPDLEALLAEEKFVYQRIELPHGLHTPGEDRSGTAKKIFPDDMKGASVLDIGCCYGFFLYEALRRGASRAVGLEKDPGRLRQARILSEVRGGGPEFSDEDLFDVLPRERFDYVLMLNVIHHLPEPMAALRAAARSARELLVVEFPTPLDPKYSKRMLPGVARILDRQPVIGVSSNRKRGQTFLFTREALRLVLTDHDDLVDSIRFLPSPKRERGRVIALCGIRESSRCCSCGAARPVASLPKAENREFGTRGECPSCHQETWWGTLSCNACNQDLGVQYLHPDLGPRCGGYNLRCPNCGKPHLSPCVC